MKRKIMFYGDCQLSAISAHFFHQLSDIFELLDCKDCGLLPFWNNDGFGNFIVWSLENREKQKEFYKCVHSKIEEADVFVFHPHEGRSVIPELNTQFITQNLKIKQSICINSFRLFCYPICKISIKPYVDHIKSKGITDENQILDYLINEPDPKFDEIFNSYRPFEEVSAEDNYIKSNSCQHLNNAGKYSNSSIIDLHDFVKLNWKHKFLSMTHNHPSFFIYEEIIKQILSILNITIEYNMRDFKYPGSMLGNTVPNFLKFNFIKKYISNIELPPGVLFTDSEKDLFQLFDIQI